MAAKATIVTTYVMNGLTATAKAINAFSQQAVSGLNKASKAADGLDASVAGAGASSTRAGAAIKTSMSGVTNSLNGVRASIVHIFETMMAAAARAGSFITGVFAKAAADTKTWLKSAVASQAGVLTGSGLAFKFTLDQGAVRRMLGVFSTVANQALGIFRRAFKLFNPFSDSGIFGLARKAINAGRFAAIPSAAVGATVARGVSAVNNTAADAAAAGIAFPDLSVEEARFRSFGGTAADATEVVGKFQGAIEDLQQNGLDSKYFDAFDKAGLANDVLSGSLTTGYQAYQAFLSQFAKVPDGLLGPEGMARLTAATTAIVGNTKAFLPFSQIINTITRDGGLEALDAQMTRFGTYIGPDQLSAVQAFTNGLSALKESFRGLSITLATAVGPGLGSFFTGLSSLIADNRDTVVSVLKSYVAGSIQLFADMAVVFTGMEKKAAETFSVFNGDGTTSIVGGFDVKNTWLFKVRDAALALWSGMKVLAGYLQVVGGAVLSIVIAKFGTLQAAVLFVAGAVGKAAVWFARFAVNLAQLANGLELDPDFQWIETLTGLLKTAGTVIGWVYGKLSDLGNAFKANPAARAFMSWVVSTLRAAGAYALEFGVNLQKAFGGATDLADGFAWVAIAVQGMQALWGWIKQAASAAIDFVGVFLGNQDALANNPGLANLKKQVEDDFLPRAKAFVGNFVSFMTAVVPPVFTTIEGVFKTLSGYVDNVGGVLKQAGEYIVSTVQAVAQYFSGAAISDKNFAWVGTLLDNLGKLAVAAKDFGAWMAGAVDAVSKFTLGQDISSDQSEKFKWVLRVASFFSTLKDILLWVGDALSKLTFGQLTPVQASLGLLFGGVLISKISTFAGWIMTVVKNLGALGGVVGRLLGFVGGPALGLLAGGSLGFSAGGIGGALAGAIGGALVAAAASSAVSAAFTALFASSATKMGSTLASSALQLASGSIGRIAGGAAVSGGLAVTAAAASVPAAGVVAGAGGAAAAAGGGLLAAFSSVPVLVTALGVVLAALIAHLTGFDKKILSFLGFGENDGNTGLDRISQALQDLKKKDAEANKGTDFESAKRKLIADANANPKTGFVQIGTEGQAQDQFPDQPNYDPYAKGLTDGILNGLQMNSNFVDPQRQQQVDQMKALGVSDPESPMPGLIALRARTAQEEDAAAADEAERRRVAAADRSPQSSFTVVVSGAQAVVSGAKDEIAALRRALEQEQRSSASADITN